MTEEFDLGRAITRRHSGLREGHEGQELVDWTVAGDIRSLYVDLINNYGTSSGSAIEQKDIYRSRRFTPCEITSSRSCPTLEYTLEGSGESVIFYLKTSEHKETVFGEPYNPDNLTAMFANDTIELRVLSFDPEGKIIKRRVKGMGWMRFNSGRCSRLFCIYPNDRSDISCIETPSNRFRKNFQLFPEEYDLLVELAPFLEAEYQKLQPRLIPSETKQGGSRLKLPVPNWFSNRFNFPWQ